MHYYKLYKIRFCNCSTLFLHFLNRTVYSVHCTLHILTFLSISNQYSCPVSIYKNHLFPISYQILSQGFIPTPELNFINASLILIFSKSFFLHFSIIHGQSFIFRSNEWVNLWVRIILVQGLILGQETILEKIGYVL